jgi:carbon storage regulator
MLVYVFPSYNNGESHAIRSFATLGRPAWFGRRPVQGAFLDNFDRKTGTRLRPFSSILRWRLEGIPTTTIRRKSAMLILSRLERQSIMIGDGITVTVLEVRGSQVRLGISAPREIRVDREELFLRRATESGSDSRPTADRPPRSRKRISAGPTRPRTPKTPRLDVT